MDIEEIKELKRIAKEKKERIYEKKRKHREIIFREQKKLDKLEQEIEEAEKPLLDACIEFRGKSCTHLIRGKVWNAVCDDCELGFMGNETCPSCKQTYSD